MTAWLTINSVCTLILAFLLYLTIRQVGVILSRVGPVGARSSDDQGPRVGENISTYIGMLPRDVLEHPPRPTLYIFGNDACSVCAVVKQAANKLVKYWNKDVDILIVFDGKPNREKPANNDEADVIRSENLRSQLGVNLVPFAIKVDDTGKVLGRGLVNNISHLESLLELGMTEIRSSEKPTGRRRML